MTSKLSHCWAMGVVAELKLFHTVHAADWGEMEGSHLPSYKRWLHIPFLKISTPVNKQISKRQVALSVLRDI